MRTSCKHLHGCVVILVNLGAFQNLQADCPVLIVSPERAASRFSYILYHATYTHRPVQLPVQVTGQCSIVKTQYIMLPARKFILQETDHLLQFCTCTATAVQPVQIPESTFLQLDKFTGKDHFPSDGRVL